MSYISYCKVRLCHTILLLIFVKFKMKLKWIIANMKCYSIDIVISGLKARLLWLVKIQLFFVNKLPIVIIRSWFDIDWDRFFYFWKILIDFTLTHRAAITWSVCFYYLLSRLVGLPFICISVNHFTLKFFDVTRKFIVIHDP